MRAVRLRSMNVVSRLALALTAPVAAMVFYACSVYVIPWSPSWVVFFLVAGVPTFFGAIPFCTRTLAATREGCSRDRLRGWNAVAAHVCEPVPGVCFR